jgi:hypothetical protein
MITYTFQNRRVEISAECDQCHRHQCLPSYPDTETPTLDDVRLQLDARHWAHVDELGFATAPHIDDLCESCATG